MVPLSFQNLALPDKFAPSTELFDLIPKSVEELEFKEGQEALGLKTFSPI